MIFVNYRKGSHSVAVAALAQRLAHHFGDGVVFVDHQMPSGSRYPDELRAQLAACHVLIAVIHEDWVSSFGRDTDWVRWEIATALDQGKLVVPVRLEGTPLPSADQLPEDITDLVHRQDAVLRAGHLNDDIDDLVRLLERHVAPSSAVVSVAVEAPPPNRTRLLVIGSAIATFGLPLALCLYFARVPLAFALAVGLSVLVGVCRCVVALIMEPLTIRWLYAQGGRTARLSFLRTLGHFWVIFALVFLGALTVWIQTMRVLGSWQLPAILLLVIVLGYWLQRTLGPRAQQDRMWLPMINQNPDLFRRAAFLLQERLTDWRPPRTRLQQQQAVAVYLALAEVRLALRERLPLTPRAWVAAGHSRSAAYYVGWAIGATGLGVASFAISLFGQDPLWPSALAAVAVPFAVVMVVVGYRIDRRYTTWLVDELTEWQREVGPLIFGTT